MQSAMHIRMGELVIKHLSGDISEEERLELDELIARSDEYRELYDDLTDPQKLIVEIERMRNWNVEASWKKIKSNYSTKKVPVWEKGAAAVVLINWRWVAATAVLIIITISGWYYFGNINGKQQYAQVTPFNPFSPYKANLKTGDGRVINLNETKNGPLDKMGYTPLIKNDSQLLYPKKPLLPDSERHTLETPNGGRFMLQLPDGSRVWLNSTSSIYFPTSFGETERRVRVDGEAFFEVAKDSSRPFIIITPMMDIRVYGTRFNIKAYENEEISTTLFEGSVKIRTGHDSAYLKPGEQAVLTKEKRIKMVTGKENTVIKKASAWRQGDFDFQGDNLKSIMEELGRWYDRKVIYNVQLSNDTYSGEFVRGRPLREILKYFEGLTGYKITVNKNFITVNNS